MRFLPALFVGLVLIGAGQGRAPVSAADAAPAGKVKDLSFDDLKFEMEKEAPFVRTLLTPKIEQLAGTKIRIRGFILPTFQQSGITRFVLVRDNMQCCFGPGAALYDCIVVEMAAGQTTDFSTRPVTVEGTFSIRELRSPDKKRHLAIYHLVGDSVK
jgi:hypothetical protein